MQIKRFISTIIVLILFGNFSFAIENSDKKKIKDESFFKELLKDHGKIWTAPGRFRTKDWILSAGLAGITAYMISNDESIYSRVKAYQNKNQWVSDISPVMTLFGDGTINLGVSGLFYLSGAILKDKITKNTGKLIFMGLIHSGIVVQLLKHLTGRQRPEAENGIDHWDGPAGFFKRYKNHRDMYYDSFPSGHTITIWTTATIIAHQYNRTIFVPMLSYSIAILSGLSRLTEDKHWLSDVFVGAVLGFAIGKFVYKKRSAKFVISPLAGKKTVGFNLNYIF